MPAYVAGSTIAAFPGTVVQVFNAESPTPGTGAAAASQAVAITPSKDGAPRTVSIDGQFAGAPGVFEVDVQVASIDANANYAIVASGNITAVDAVNQDFHLDVQTAAPFVRLLLKSRTNAVALTAYIARG